MCSLFIFFSMLGLEYPFIDFIKILQSLKLKNQIYIYVRSYNLLTI